MPCSSATRGWLLAALLLAGCGGQPLRHTLHLPPPAAVAEAPVVRVSLPVYADARHIVHRGANGLLLRRDGHEWAEPPADGFARLLAEQLATESGFRHSQVLRLQFTRFDVEADGRFRALGNWQLRAGGLEQAAGRIDFDTPLADDSAAATVAAMSEAVAYSAGVIRRGMAAADAAATGATAAETPRTTETADTAASRHSSTGSEP